MLTIQTRQPGIGNVAEKYQLDAAVMKSDNIWVGAVICYLLATDEALKFRSLYGDGDCGDGETLPYIYCGGDDDMGILSDVSEFTKRFIKDGITKWHLECMLDGSEVTFYGHSYGTGIGVFIAGDGMVDVTPVLKHVEECIQEMH